MDGGKRKKKTKSKTMSKTMSKTISKTKPKKKCSAEFMEKCEKCKKEKQLGDFANILDPRLLIDPFSMKMNPFTLSPLMQPAEGVYRDEKNPYTPDKSLITTRTDGKIEMSRPTGINQIPKYINIGGGDIDLDPIEKIEKRSYTLNDFKGGENIDHLMRMGGKKKANMKKKKVIKKQGVNKTTGGTKKKKTIIKKKTVNKSVGGVKKSKSIKKTKAKLSKKK
jgi:hypothetical protein